MQVSRAVAAGSRHPLFTERLLTDVQRICEGRPMAVRRSRSRYGDLRRWPSRLRVAAGLLAVTVATLFPFTSGAAAEEPTTVLGIASPSFSAPRPCVPRSACKPPPAPAASFVGTRVQLADAGCLSHLADGTIVLCGGPSGLWRLDLDGRLRPWWTTGLGDRSLSHLAAAADGGLVAAASDPNTVWHIGVDGVARELARTPFEVAALAASPDGGALLAGESTQVHRLTPDGRLEIAHAETFSGVGGLAALPAGGFVVSDWHDGGRVTRIEPDGRVTRLVRESPSLPMELAVRPNGSVLVLGHAPLEIAPDGSVGPLEAAQAGPSVSFGVADVLPDGRAAFLAAAPFQLADDSHVAVEGPIETLGRPAVQLRRDQMSLRSAVVRLSRAAVVRIEVRRGRRVIADAEHELGPGSTTLRLGIPRSSRIHELRAVARFADGAIATHAVMAVASGTLTRTLARRVIREVEFEAGDIQIHWDHRRCRRRGAARFHCRRRLLLSPAGIPIPEPDGTATVTLRPDGLIAYEDRGSDFSLDRVFEPFPPGSRRSRTP